MEYNELVLADYERLIFCKKCMRREEILLEWVDDLVNDTVSEENGDILNLLNWE